MLQFQDKCAILYKVLHRWMLVIHNKLTALSTLIVTLLEGLICWLQLTHFLTSHICLICPSWNAQMYINKNYGYSAFPAGSRCDPSLWLHHNGYAVNYAQDKILMSVIQWCKKAQITLMTCSPLVDDHDI